MSTKLVAPPPLRSYQRLIGQAIMRSVVERAGRSFSVMIARQGGKNEVSACIEAALLTSHRDTGGAIVKTAPTLSPQLGISRQRLVVRLRGAGLRELLTVRGDTITLGAASITFLSGQPDANVVGHTASLLLEVDEAQEIDPEKFERDFRPMILSTGATVVFYGTTWEPDSLLERVKARHLELEAEDGIKRHFEYDYEAVARDFPAYEQRALEQRDLLGETNPIWLSQYCLLPQDAINKLFTLEEIESIRGQHAEFPTGNFPPAREEAPRAVPRSRTLPPGLSSPPGTGEAEARYVAGLDIGGATPGPERDPTVLTIARLVSTAPALPHGQKRIEVVTWSGIRWVDAEDHYAEHYPERIEVIKLVSWQTAWDDVLADLVRWNRFFNFGKIAVDSTGLGHHAAVGMEREFGSSRVEKVNFNERSKSGLCYELRDVIEAGRLRMYKGDDRHSRLFWQQLAAGRMETRGRTGLITFGAAGPHDDYLISLALSVRAATNSRPRIAFGRPGRDYW